MDAWDEILPSYVGILNNRLYKDPFLTNQYLWGK